MYNRPFVFTSPQRTSIPSTYQRQIPPQFRQIVQQPPTYRVPPSPIRYQIQQPIYRPPPPQYNQIYQTSPVRQYSNSIHQQVVPRVQTFNPPIQSPYITQSRAAQPNYYLRQSQPYQPKQFVQQTPTLPKNQPQQQSYQQRPSVQQQTQPNYQPQYQHKQQYSQPPIMSQQEEDLEKKFQEAIDRTRDLVQKYHQPPQPCQVNELQDLALQYEDGYIYRGQGFEPAVREGFGVLTDQNDNEVYSGYWKDNQYEGSGKLINFAAEQIEGPFDYRDLSNIENGWLGYEGEFHQGKMNGEGTLQLTNGEKFQGQFNDGMIDGNGVYTTIDHQQIQGLWRDGVMVQ